MSKVNIQSTVLSDRDKQMQDKAIEIVLRGLSTVLAHHKVAIALDGTMVVLSMDESDRLANDLADAVHLMTAIARGAADPVPAVGGHEVV